MTSNSIFVCYKLNISVGALMRASQANTADYKATTVVANLNSILSYNPTYNEVQEAKYSSSLSHEPPKCKQ